MRKTTLASLLILCGSTAAFASVAAPGSPQATNNSATMNAMMSNDTMPGDAMRNDLSPDPAVTPSEDRPLPNPTATPDMMRNEMTPKPM